MSTKIFFASAAAVYAAHEGRNGLVIHHIIFCRKGF